MFPGATATVYRNEAGEPTGWSNESYDDPYEPSEEQFYGDEMVCHTHKCFAGKCPASCQGDNLSHEDEFCCGPDGCCTGRNGCCGTDEDEIRGEWHVCQKEGVEQ